MIDNNNNSSSHNFLSFLGRNNILCAILTWWRSDDDTQMFMLFNTWIRWWVVVYQYAVCFFYICFPNTYQCEMETYVNTHICDMWCGFCFCLFLADHSPNDIILLFFVIILRRWKLLNSLLVAFCFLFGTFCHFRLLLFPSVLFYWSFANNERIHKFLHNTGKRRVQKCRYLNRMFCW